MSSRRRRDTIFLCFDSRNNRIRRPADLGICLDPDRFAFRAEEVGDQVWNQINFGDSAQKSNLCFFASGTPKYPSRGRCSRFRQADGEFTMSSSVLTTVRLEVDTLKIRDLKMTWIGLILVGNLSLRIHFELIGTLLICYLSWVRSGSIGFKLRRSLENFSADYKLSQLFG